MVNRNPVPRSVFNRSEEDKEEEEEAKDYFNGFLITCDIH